MTPRPTALLAVALAGALLAGCAGSGGEAAPTAVAATTPSATPGPSPSEQSARDELQAALALLTTTTYKYTVTGDYQPKEKIRATGSRDPKARKATWTVKVTSGGDAWSTRHLVIGAARYRAEGSGKWKADTKADAADPGGLSRFATAVTTTLRTGPHALRGSFYIGKNLTILPLGAPGIFFPGGAMPDFTAKTDAQGHLTSITVIVKFTDGTMKQTTTFSGYGEPVTISKPA
ncbi:hypothetical protein [Actinoplanes sp. NPDC026619]|uniref:hypothetical protein n=1 Tax=Actinoplanes sp. NPDC026619 TaxID=3155798 RepID=UPI0033FACE2E